MYTDTGLWNDTLNSYNANNYYATKNCGFICEWDNQTIKSYYAIIGDNFKHLVLRSPLKRNGKTDTDSDTLTDWEEFDSENEFLDWTSTGEPIFPTYGKLQDKISFVPHELMVELNGLDNYLDTVYVAPFKSNPMVGGEDTDGDGLYDGVARYVGLRKAVPKDPEPKYYNGPTGLWEKQYQSVGSSRLTCNYNYEQIGEYSNSRLNMVSTIDDLKIYAPNLYNALSKAGEKLSEFINAKNMVDLALSKGSIIKDEKVKDTLKQISQYIKPYATYTEFGAYILNFVYDSKNIAYHSQVDTWQRKFGYADLYDEVFDIGSKMNYLRESFSNGYMLWLWKGDYWNLYSGAEIGLYRYNRRVGSYDYYDAIDYELPMTINLYNYNNNDWENVFSWHPYIEQWWITGFNPNFKTPDSDKMYVIGTISFKDDEKLFNDFANGHRKIKYNNIFENYIYDREDNTIWIMWH
jgi:hypothetical protein